MLNAKIKKTSNTVSRNEQPAPMSLLELTSTLPTLQVMHRCFHLTWSKIKVLPGNNIPLGILAGQMCSRILAPWKLRQKLYIPDDPPTISAGDWESDRAERARAWANEKTYRARGEEEQSNDSGWDGGPVVEEVVVEDDDWGEQGTPLLPWRGLSLSETEKQVVPSVVSEPVVLEAEREQLQIVEYTRRETFIKAGTLSVVMGTLFGLLGAFQRPSP
jgi:hypothetical protein